MKIIDEIETPLGAKTIYYDTGVYQTISINGRKTWYNQFHQKHKDNGPAIEEVNGSNEYWINGVRVTAEEFFET